MDIWLSLLQWYIFFPSISCAHMHTERERPRMNLCTLCSKPKSNQRPKKKKLVNHHWFNAVITIISSQNKLFDCAHRPMEFGIQTKWTLFFFSFFSCACVYEKNKNSSRNRNNNFFFLSRFNIYLRTDGRKLKRALAHNINVDE